MLINTGESGIVYCMECRKYVGLTLTWDVLKLIVCHFIPPNKFGLTLTWDVLKHDKVTFNRWKKRLINFNMGCIETILKRLPNEAIPRLTLTWDVLKLFRNA